MPLPHPLLGWDDRICSNMSVVSEPAQIPRLKPEAEGVAVGNRSGKCGRVQASLRADHVAGRRTVWAIEGADLLV